MSLRDFWISARSCKRMTTPSATGDVRLNGNEFETFDPGEFSFLADEERGRLVEAVHAFQALAEQAPATGPTPAALAEQARIPLQEILEIADPDKYLDWEAWVVGKRLEQALAGQLPEWVRSFRFETGKDVVGDPAVWIWVVVADEAADDDAIFQRFREVRKTIETTLRRLGIERWPYVRLRSVEEQALLELEKA